MTRSMLYLDRQKLITLIIGVVGRIALKFLRNWPDDVPWITKGSLKVLGCNATLFDSFVEGIYALRVADIAAISKNMKVGNLSKAHSSTMSDFVLTLNAK